eukprot:760660-Hanusia_phi.AAC.3
MRLLDSLPPLLRFDVDEFLYSKPGNMKALLKDMHPVRDLKHVIVDEEGFLIVTENGFEERSEPVAIRPLPGLSQSSQVSPVVAEAKRSWHARQFDSRTSNLRLASLTLHAGMGVWQRKVPSPGGSARVADSLSGQSAAVRRSLCECRQVHAILMEWVPMSANEFGSCHGILCDSSDGSCRSVSGQV